MIIQDGVWRSRNVGNDVLLLPLYTLESSHCSISVTSQHEVWCGCDRGQLVLTIAAGPQLRQKVNMGLTEYLDIPYISSEPQNRFHTFDFYVPEGLLSSLHQHDASVPLVCFIHGGAWRSEDKADHTDLARKLATSTGYPVAVPNYRLTPREPTPTNYLHHPEHAKDVLHFLEFICSWSQENDPSSKYPFPHAPNKLFLLGHSCAAHILCSIFLHMPKEEGLDPSLILRRNTAAIMMSEGIYDINQLVSRFPDYRAWFIESVFGKQDYGDFSATTAKLRSESQHIRWLIIHSKGDHLVDEAQSSNMYEHLRKITSQEQVAQVFDELGEHNDVLKGDQYVEIIDKHIKGVMMDI